MRQNQGQGQGRRFRRSDGPGDRRRNDRFENDNRHPNSNSGNRFRPIDKKRDALNRVRENRNKKHNKDSDELNKEMNQYWMKSGNKGKVTQNKVVQEKLNDDMDDYWRKKDQTEKAKPVPKAE